MAAPFQLEIATPERLLVREDAVEAEVPCESGYVGILPGHAPLLSELGFGELRYTLAGGTKRSVGIHGGWLEVSGNSVRVLANTAEHADEIDLKRAEEALKRASERLRNPVDTVDVARALNSLKRAQARLNLASNSKNGHS